ncbi:NAD(P)-dependent dehydrogenase (short-subunit alcohol dehydrogenase family) [Novosphingobium sp. PhB165]|uniref:SDR family oxidoreductase n=1 Tax=Novosphingobium sp. PhB165 TaxID=2485105 RepID=UPI0010DEC17C|nr:SDR family oxidoreductase [Novosphingobium sp. PhB165]TCM16091.1 NAD(P)-dependent dehydrogenase (short-subunit alcohol dehydrogenase family) [Novosphingobium sp. PhB165]
MVQGLDGLGYRGKTVVVTGGASGMGEAVARILGELGALVHIVDIQAPKVPHAGFHACDLSDFAQVRATAEALKALAPIDFLFPCAGLPPHVKGALYCMRVNYIGTRLLVEQLVPSLADGAGIALISSDAAMGWQKNLAQSLEMLAISDPDEALAWVEADPAKRLRDGYTTSKEMLVVWVQNAAVALGNSRRIRFNAIGPCPTKTAFMEQSADVLSQEFLDSWPYPSLGRIATAEDQAWPLILLNSPLNGAVTGSFLYTDQGFASGVMTGAIDPSFMMGSQKK